MFAMPGLRAFTLAAERSSDAVSCGADGVFVGDVPLLQAINGASANPQWVVRTVPELNDELSTQYGLPIDVAAKANALALIAAAFNRGDLAMAAIATVQMQFPDPPPLAKGRETDDEIARRALELHRSRLLKFWDPEKHPRTGTPPNPGWFAPESGESERPVPPGPESITALPAAMVGDPFKRPPIVEVAAGAGAGGLVVAVHQNFQVKSHDCRSKRHLSQQLQRAPLLNPSLERLRAAAADLEVQQPARRTPR